MVALAAERYGELLDLDAIRTALCAKSLRHFVREAWHVVEPATPYHHNWHIDALCDHLEACLRGEIRNLLITMPPRAMKSLTVSVFFPAWAWIQRPELRFLYASYASQLAGDHSQACRMVVESEWYQSRWGDRVRLLDDDNLKTRFTNAALGRRIATSVGASVTGFGGDFVIVDDPHNVQQVESDTVRAAAVRWWNKAMSTRLNDPRTGVRIVVMQRVHETDVAGSVLEQGTYTHLNLPMAYEPTEYVGPGGWTDPRTAPGELLWPDRYPPEHIARMKVELGSYDYAAQFQQRPSPATGGLVKRHWWRFWQHDGTDLPPVLATDDKGHAVAHPVATLPSLSDRAALSWDMTFDKTEAGSYVVGLAGQTWGPNVYVTDRYRARVGFTESIAAILAMREAHPEITTTLIEKAANGAAALNMLSAQVTGLLPIRPDGSKLARLNAILPLIEAGNVVLPHPQLAPWVGEFIDELAAFPNGAQDDQVDATSQLCRYLMPPGLDDGGIDLLRQYQALAFGDD